MKQRGGWEKHHLTQNVIERWNQEVRSVSAVTSQEVDLFCHMAGCKLYKPRLKVTTKSVMEVKKGIEMEGDMRQDSMTLLLTRWW